MRNPEYSSVDPYTGNVTFNGPLSLEKGDHSHMPSRTSAYLPSDERGHVNASSLGGVNSRSNVVAQHRDVNDTFMSVEKGERTALKNGAAINSEKTAIVNGQPGDRPSLFMINDSVTFSDGHTESVHHSFTNESYSNQAAWNDISASLTDTFDSLNPGDDLRSSMNSESYASLMENTDAEMPGLSDEYIPADFCGNPNSANTVSANTDMDVSNNTTSGNCYSDVISSAESVDFGNADAGNGNDGAEADVN